MARSGAPIGRRGAMLNATCRLMVRQRSVAMDPWILDPQTAGETQNFLESTPLSFLRAGPPKFRRISAESRAHPNFDKKFAKLGPRPSSAPLHPSLFDEHRRATSGIKSPFLLPSFLLFYEGGTTPFASPKPRLPAKRPPSLGGASASVTIQRCSCARSCSLRACRPPTPIWPRTWWSSRPQTLTRRARGCGFSSSVSPALTHHLFAAGAC